MSIYTIVLLIILVLFATPLLYRWYHFRKRRTFILERLRIINKKLKRNIKPSSTELALVRMWIQWEYVTPDYRRFYEHIFGVGGERGRYLLDFHPIPVDRTIQWFFRILQGMLCRQQQLSRVS